MATEILVKGVPSRILPQSQMDAQREGIPFRLDRYGSVYVQGEVLKIHPLADEGSYFVTNNGQTAILSSPAVGFVSTTPALILVNNDSPSNPAAKRIYLDYMELLVTTAGITATATQAKMMAVVVDQTNRYVSGGTDLSAKIVSPNMDNALRSSVAQVVFGALLANAANSARTVVGQRLVRLPVTATTAPDLVNDLARFEFGSTDTLNSNTTGSAAGLQANVIQSALKLPPVIIGPGQSALIYIWQLAAGGSLSSAASYLPEIGWWER
jgi:hypothetical protein